jgi:ATP-dependent helicase/nuclease subunit B
MRLATVLVPDAAHATDLRAALYEARGHRACIPPRIATLDAWATGQAKYANDDAAREQVDLFQALRASNWVREQAGSQAAAVWSLARDIAHVSDELTLHACGRAEAFAGRWQAAVRKHFTERAASAGEPQAQLVLALWRAGLSQEHGAARLQAQLERRLRSARGMLYWVLPHGAQAWQREFASAYAMASGAQVCIVTADWTALAASNPWMRAAWPELESGAAVVPGAAPDPIAQRASALADRLARTSGIAALRPNLVIWKCESLEEEADAAASWTVERLRAGDSRIALVALDRLAARRVRALLDRANVMVADSSGWKLSTTSAAAAVMHWIDVVLSDFGVEDLLDWIRSPFVLARQAGKEAVVAQIADALRREKVRTGAQAVRAAVAQLDAVATIDQLIELARPWPHPGSLGRCFGLLAATLEALGMRDALAADPVGEHVLEAIDVLHAELIGSDLPIDLREFRSFLAAQFEARGSGDRAIDSPVEMLTLGATRLQQFDSALLLGVDASHLDGRTGPDPLLADSVRRELGLRTDGDRDRELLRDLAALLANTPRVVATWRRQRDDQPQALAAPLDRLAMVAQIAGMPGVVHAAAPSWLSTQGADPAPRAARAPDMLPARVSASAYQDLVDCPYRFFALRVLGLQDLRRTSMHPDNRDFGEILHEILFAFHRERPQRREDDLAMLRSICERSFARRLVQQPALIATRQRVRQLLRGYVDWVHETEDEGWTWMDGEFAARRSVAFAPGAQVELQGRLDRIDRDADGERRILDYKARDVTQLRKGLRIFGEDVQLHFYGLLVDPPAGHAAYASVRPPRNRRDPDGAVVHLVPPPGSFAEDCARLLPRVLANLQSVQAGAAMPANGIEEICRRCELRCLCRHGYVRNGESGANGGEIADA